MKLSQKLLAGEQSEITGIQVVDEQDSNDFSEEGNVVSLQSHLSQQPLKVNNHYDSEMADGDFPFGSPEAELARAAAIMSPPRLVPGVDYILDKDGCQY